MAGAVAGMMGCSGDEVVPERGGPHRDHEPDGSTTAPDTSTSDDPERDEGDADASSTGEPARPVRPRPPNIIFITLDDIGWTTLPAYGNPYIATPGLDALVDGGILFSNAFLVTSSCSPSRGTFLTGQYPHTNGLTGLVHHYPEMAIPKDYPTLPRMFAEVGYACGHQGKWHVSSKNSKKFGFHEELNDITGNKFIPTADLAIDFIRRRRSLPFYLQLDFVETHAPYEEHEGIHVDPDAVDVLPHWMMPNWPKLRRLAAGYFEELVFVDRMIANVLQALEELGLAENTLIVVTSDNGSPFPGNKGTLYDRGIRTPLIVHWPAQAAVGETSNAYVSSVDVPVALALAGLPRLPEGMQGERGLFDFLDNPHGNYRDSIYSEMTYHEEYCPARSIRTDRWKYIRNLSSDPWGVGAYASTEWAYALLELPGHDWLEPRPPVELYDLDADPDEVHNLAHSPDHQAIRGEMHVRLLEAAQQLGDDAYDLDV